MTTLIPKFDLMNGGSTPTGAVNRAINLKLSEFVSVKDFGAVGDGTTDDTSAFTNAIASLGSIGGKIYVPAGNYKVTSTIYLTSGVSLIGDGYYNAVSSTREGVSNIYAVHSGVAVISLKGAVGCTIQDICIDTNASTFPKTGLCLGRSTSASAGYHKFHNVAVYGYYSVAAIYSIASEDNLWENVNCWLFGGGAKYNLYTGISDALTVDSLYTSSNLDNVFIHPFFINASTNANAANIYIQGAQAVGSWSFFGGYLTAYAGSYVEISTGAIDNLSMLGPITFIGTSGEILSGGDPLYGFKLTTSGSGLRIPGLTILGCRFAFQAGTSHYLFYQPGNLYLLNPNIVIQPSEASPYATIQLVRSQIMGGIVDIGRTNIWTAPTLNSGWSNTYGSPYAQIAYKPDPDGWVNLRGMATGGTGTIFTLPSTLYPSYSQIFSTSSNGAVATILIDTSGNVTLLSGSAVSVDLTPVRFNINYQY